ncbi:MAG: hypothetical protein ABIP48_22805 [Planctomycetota bacterium]
MDNVIREGQERNPSHGEHEGHHPPGWVPGAPNIGIIPPTHGWDDGRIYPPQPPIGYPPRNPVNGRPPRNEIPVEVPVQVEVEKNTDFSLVGRKLTPEVLKAWQDNAKQKSEEAVAEIRDLIPEEAAEARAKLEAVARRASSGALNTDDLIALAAMMKLTLPANMARTANLRFYRLAMLSRWVALLSTAVPGATSIPQGNQVPMVLVPGLPRGMIIVLGNGAVMIGVGDLCLHVAVGRGNCAQAAGMTVGIGPSLAESEAKPIMGGSLLMNAEDTAVNYNVNNNPFSIKPGFTQTLPGGRDWVVVFDRGSSFGQAKYTPSEGTYKFTLTEKGWDLFRHTFTCAIDNGENPFEFRYVVDHEVQGLPPGEAREHSSIYPMVFRFDNGRGETKTKNIQEGLYKVGVTLENTLDLYAEDAVAPPSYVPPPSEATPPPPPPPPAAVTANVVPNETPPDAPPSTEVATSGFGKAAGSSLFGDQGDWRPSLFVSDVEEIAYFEESPAEGDAAPGTSVPLPFTAPS